jgi:hypothetical protein
MVRFPESDEELEFGGVRHFVGEKLFVFIGIDPRVAGHFSGKVAYVTFAMGPGAMQLG